MAFSETIHATHAAMSDFESQILCASPEKKERKTDPNSSSDEFVEMTQSPVKKPRNTKLAEQFRELVPDSQPGTPSASQNSVAGFSQFVNAISHDEFLRGLVEFNKDVREEMIRRGMLHNQARKKQQTDRVGPIEHTGRATSLTAAFGTFPVTPGPVDGKESQTEVVDLGDLVERERYVRGVQRKLSADSAKLLDQAQSLGRREEKLQNLKTILDRCLSNIGEIRVTLDFISEQVNYARSLIDGDDTD